MSKNQESGDANPVLYRTALKAFERYLDMGLFLKGDKLFPALSLKVIERARQESQGNA
jgi:hypothetical protein